MEMVHIGRGSVGYYHMIQSSLSRLSHQLLWRPRRDRLLDKRRDTEASPFQNTEGPYK